MVRIPGRIHRCIQFLAEANHRPFSRQLEVVVGEWLEWSDKQTEMVPEDAPHPLGEWVRQLRLAEEDWKNSEPKARG